jgi:ATP-dependent Clp protease ATP-binding subunit ClpA
MSESNYKVHKEWVKEAEFEILILEIPREDIEDKLAYLARDKGSITRSFFEDFVIATCVANINQLLFHIKQQHINPPSLMGVRAEVMKLILVVNPILNPENLVINRNAVVKIKEETGPKDDQRLLTDNKAWNISYYDEVLDKHEGDPNLDQKIPAPTKGKKKGLPSEMKNMDDLEFEVQKQWWKRINKYIKVKQFKEDDMATILSQRYFHNRSSFQTYIVSVCVVDSEDLFVMLDNMGIPSRVAPPILMHEVYELCKEANPFLTYENASEFTDNLNEDETDDNTPRRAPNRMASHARQQSSKKKQPKKKFKDVPKADLLRLAAAMKVFVIGQDEAIENIVEAVQRASIGLKEPNKPIGSFLFAGRTGIGKTLTTKVLADELIKDRNNLVNIDCSEYSADHEYAKLIGAPSGYVGHEQGGILTNAIIENPFSVIVFDEVEKASHKVHELMLQILEEGRLTDGRGQKVSFKDCVLIMTSNVGVGEVDAVKKTIGFGDVAELTEDRKNRAIGKAIKKKFKPEFLNRIDAIVHFNGLKKEDYMRIIDLELYKLNENLKANDTEYKDLALEFDKKVKNLIYKEGIDDDFGARPLKRCIEKEISNTLASALLKENITPNAKVVVSVKKGKMAFKFDTEFFQTEEHKEMVAEE